MLTFSKTKSNILSFASSEIQDSLIQGDDASVHDGRLRPMM